VERYRLVHPLGREGMDAGLWRIVDRGLAKDPEDRWQSAAALAAALRTWQAKKPSQAFAVARYEATRDAGVVSANGPPPGAPTAESVTPTCDAESFDGAIFAALGGRAT
jgi:hypothetical protein